MCITHVLSVPTQGVTIYTRIRFQIEDVDEPDHQEHQLSISAGQADLTVHSFGYNTAEAVPMTVYYRDSGENEGKARPSLDNLRKAEVKKQLEPAQVSLPTYVMFVP